MKPRTPRQRLQLLAGSIALVCTPVMLFGTRIGSLGEWFRYLGTGVVFLNGVMFLWMGS